MSWLMIPAIAVMVAVLAFNFVGDGVRDAADPYSDLGSVDISCYSAFPCHCE